MKPVAAPPSTKMEKMSLELKVRALKKCLDTDPEFFSPWEHSFIESCFERQEKYRKVFFSEKQAQALQKVWEKFEKR